MTISQRKISTDQICSWFSPYPLALRERGRGEGGAPAGMRSKGGAGVKIELAGFKDLSGQELPAYLPPVILAWIPADAPLTKAMSQAV
jgi:hypothetical protein